MMQVHAETTAAPFEAEMRSTAARYDSLHGIHGNSWRTLDWGSREGQVRRFEVLGDAGLHDGMRVLDVGCGLGHFAEWAAAQGLQLDYTGLELSAELATTAAARHTTHRIVQGSVLDPALLSDECFDLVISSGIFFSYPEGGDQFLRATVTRMWQWCTRAVSFNSLSTWAPQRDAGEYYADPAATLAFSRSLTSRVALRHDYHPRDFTIVLRREDDRT
jgi:predicted TPR repeat methyltransferase